MSHLSATYLTWQGWLFTSEHGSVMVDPLLNHETGRGPEPTRHRLMFWPPREVDFGAMPGLDAVMLTHEHEDHFDLATLARLDRRIPLLLSERSSASAWQVLREMGFSVEPLRPGLVHRVGSLEFEFFGPDHLRHETIDEWDGLGFRVRHLGGAGAFYTPVDLEIPASTQARVASSLAGLETLSFEGMSVGRWRPGAEITENGHALPPLRAFRRGDQAWQSLQQGERMAAVPGQTWRWEDGRVVSVEDGTPALRCPPCEQWPARPRLSAREGTRLTPVCGQLTLDPGDVEELERGLQELGAYLYGREHFQLFLSLDEAQCQGRKPTLLLLLQTGEGGQCRAYEYQLTRAGFERVRVTRDIEEHYVVSFACWATDLLGLLRSEFEPRAIARSMDESWLEGIEARSIFLHVFWPFFHPLCRPLPLLRQYQRAAARLASVPAALHPGAVALGAVREQTKPA